MIFHQAAARSVPRSMLIPGFTTDVNVRGTLNVLLAANEQSARVVSASSSSVYGDQDIFPLREDMAPKPRSPYAASKLAAEILCESWLRTYGVPSISLRYFNVYGPGQDPTSEYATLIPKFVLACLRDERPVIHGNGEQARDFTYIDDVVEANLLAARAPDEAWGKAFNIGGGQTPTTVNQILAIVAELTGAEPDPTHTDPRPGDVLLTDADISLAGSLLGYKPEVPVKEGLQKAVEWFSARFSPDSV